ncbi:MAG TPA: hypothetical protein VNI57_06415 [Candidatus Saccharimonadales bacterium]|nr:hypothetical protein [Candidatus Saccharimonadales bacterium]
MRTKPRFAVLAALVVAFGILQASAQEEETFDLFRPQLQIGLESTADRNFKEDEPPFINAQEDTYRWQAADLNLNLPLGGTRLGSSGKLLGHQVFMHVSTEGSRAQLSFLQDDLSLYRGGLGFTALMLGRSRRLYAAGLFANFAEEKETVSKPDVRYTGLAVGSVRKGSALILYGGAFTYQLGRGLVLPLFGALGSIGPNWTIGGVFPFLFKARYQSSPKWNLGLFMKVRGNRYGFEDREDAFGQGRNTHLDVRLVEGRIGAGIGWVLSHHLTLSGEAGSSVARRLIVTDGTDDILRAGMKPAPYARIQMKIAFGETLMDSDAP